MSPSRTGTPPAWSSQPAAAGTGRTTRHCRYDPHIPATLSNFSKIAKNYFGHVQRILHILKGNIVEITEEVDILVKDINLKIFF